MPPRAKAALSHISETLKRQLTRIRNAAKHQYFKHVTMKKYKPPVHKQKGMYGLPSLSESETIKRHAYQRRTPTKAGHTGRPAHPEYIGELAKRQLQRLNTKNTMKYDNAIQGMSAKVNAQKGVKGPRAMLPKIPAPYAGEEEERLVDPRVLRRSRPTQGPRRTEAQVPIHAPSGTFSDMGPSSSKREPEEEEQGFYTAPSSPTHSPVVERKAKKKGPGKMEMFVNGMSEDQRHRYFNRTLPMLGKVPIHSGDIRVHK